MAIFRRRFSTQERTQIFIFCAFPIHIWAIVIMFRDVPSWLFYMSRADMVGSASYHLTFALFETALVYLVVSGIGHFLPQKWVPEPFLTLSSVLLIEFSIMAIVFQYFILQYSPVRWLLVVYVVILGLTLMIVPRLTKLRKVARLVAERLTVLTLLYIVLDVVGLIVVIARNVVSAT